MTNPLVTAALSYLSAGLSTISAVMPSKKPGGGGWERWQDEQMPASELESAVKRDGGVGVVTGFNQLEAIDFDAGGFSWIAFRDAVLKEDPELLGKCYVEKSVSGGRHLVYRADDIKGNAKLTNIYLEVGGPGKGEFTRHGKTMRYDVIEKDGKLRLLLEGAKKTQEIKKGRAAVNTIETRGIGGFLVVAPTAGYEVVVGDLTKLPVLTGAERRVLIDAARGLSDTEPGSASSTPVSAVVEYDPRTDYRIGTWYSANGDHKALLEKHHWTQEGVKDGNEQWIRPGKESGLGATWSLDKRLFYVFTSSTAFEQGRAYPLYAVFCELEFDGDYAKATKALEKKYPEEVKRLKKLEKVAAGAAAGPAVVAAVQMDTGRGIADTHEQQLRVLLGIRQHMIAGNITFDAIGVIRQDGEISSHCVPSLTNEIVFNLRNDKSLASTQVSEALLNIQRRDSIIRRQSIVGRMVGNKATKEGERELERFLNAVSPAWRQEDKVALMHLMWNVKTMQLGRKGQRQMLVCLFNPTQDAGKSEAAKKFIAPWCELAMPKFEARILVDEKRTKVLSQLAIANIDEMAGMATADLEELKSKITADLVSYRPMQTNEFVPIPMRMSFIATSNKPLCEIVRDSTGIRRFYEIKTRDKLLWDEINSINYEVMWSAVSEDDPAPGVMGRIILAKAQGEMAYADSVGQWLEHEDTRDGRFTFQEESGVVNSQIMYTRYSQWCEMNGERALSVGYLGRRLRTFGWERVQMRVGDVRTWVYRHDPGI